MRAKSLAAVAVGAAVGTGLRLGLDAAVPHDDSGFPVSTLVINVVGSFVLGFLVTRLWPRVEPWVRAGLGPGLMGSFTTFSAVAVSLVALGPTPLALGYLVATIGLGMLAAWAGLVLGARP
jgi:CrcB protein